MTSFSLPSAIASKISSSFTAIKGLLSAIAKPLAIPSAILTPVNEPGPIATAILSISFIVKSEILNKLSIIGITIFE